MSAAAELLCEEIRASGPIPFHRFMEVALYHPEHGYYRRGRDPFGKAGDFYTAEQLQPVFGILIASMVRSLFEEMGRPEGFRTVELGAGRAEMEPYLREFGYLPVDAGRGSMPEAFTGLVFANEFFDALPVDVFVRRGGGYREMRVGIREGRLEWVESESPGEEVLEYIARHLAGAGGEGAVVEVNLESHRWIERIAACLERGYVLAIDYGYTAAELARFPRGTLMTYRRHRAQEDALADPGERDITAHVNFTALENHAADCGLRKLRFERLAQTLMYAGESDQFAAALAGETQAERMRRTLQLKTLLFGLGETFRTMLLSKTGPK